jgi:hypothetical protein
MTKNIKKYLMILFATTAMATSSEAMKEQQKKCFSSNKYAECGESKVAELLMAPKPQRKEDAEMPRSKSTIHRMSLGSLLSLPGFDVCLDYLEESDFAYAARNVYKLRKINGTAAVRAFEENPEADVFEMFHSRVGDLYLSLFNLKDAILRVNQLARWEKEQIIDMGTCSPYVGNQLEVAHRNERQWLTGVNGQARLMVDYIDEHAYEALPSGCLKPAKCAWIFLGKVVRNFCALFR